MSIIIETMTAIVVLFIILACLYMHSLVNHAFENTGFKLTSIILWLLAITIALVFFRHTFWVFIVATAVVDCIRVICLNYVYA